MANRMVLGGMLSLFGAACTACSGTPPEAPPAPGQPLAQAAGMASCTSAQGAADPARQTSKSRHIPDEMSPCQDSRGPARPQPASGK